MAAGNALAAIAAEKGVEQFIFPYEDWIDLTNEITGSQFPENFLRDKIPT